MSSEQTPALEPPLWRRIWSPPEAEVSSVGYGGEMLVASVRLAIVFALLYFPIPELRLKRRSLDPLALLTTATVGLVLALAVHPATHRSRGRRWLGFVRAVLDVSLV